MKQKKIVIEHKHIFIFVISICIAFLFIVQFILNDEGGASSEPSADVHFLDNITIYDGNINNPIDDPSNFQTDNYVWITGVFPDDIELSSSLGFYTLHQNVSVMISDGNEQKTIYEFSRAESKLLFGKSPGHAYNIIENIHPYSGKAFTIYLYSPYGISNSTLPTFMIAPTDRIIATETTSSLPTFLASAMILILGFSLTLMWFVLKRYISNDNLTLLYSGVFSIFVAIWTANEQPILSYVWNNSILTAYLSFISLMLIPIGFILFFRELCNTKENKIWDIALSVNYLNILVSTLLQAFDICDFKETLFFNQILIVLTVITIFIYSTIIVFKQRTTSGYVNFVSVICLYVGYFMYLYKFYTDQLYDLYYGSIFVIVYIFAIIYIYIRKSIRAMLKSDRAEFYENLAYKDSLTDLLNRLAYDTAIATVDVNKAAYIIVIFDLNNLKHFNDVYGHNIGDTYIKDSSALIQEAFQNLGNVYRIGGDEFCIIMKDKSIFQYETATRRLDTLVYNYNKVSDVLKINIAYGYALYDSSIDKDIYETRNRADAMMYQKKFYMKQQQSGSVK